MKTPRTRAEPSARESLRDELFGLPRTVAELNEPKVRPEVAHRVKTARVAFADYALLQRDFPQLATKALKRAHPALRRLAGAALSRAVRERIDAWLVEHAALMSRTQCLQAVANEPIAFDPRPVQVARPPLYGRALVASPPGPSGGLLDLKGAGLGPGKRPKRFRRHGYEVDGLVHLGEAFKEYAVARLLEGVFRHARVRFYALPIYAVLALGFRTSRGLEAGLIVRRGHRRHAHGADFYHPLGSVPYRVQVLVEMLLRQVGLSTARGQVRVEIQGRRVTFMESGVHHRPLGYRRTREFLQVVAQGQDLALYQMINVQTTPPVHLEPPAAQLVDFQAFWGIERAGQFPRPSLMLAGTRMYRWGGCLSPGHPSAISPPRDRLTRRWMELLGDLPRGRTAARRRFRTGEALQVFCFELAEELSSGQTSPASARRRLDAYVDEALALVRRRPRPTLEQAARASEALFVSASREGTFLLELNDAWKHNRLVDLVETAVAFDEVDFLLAGARSSRPLHLDSTVLRVAHSKTLRLLGDEDPALRALTRRLSRPERLTLDEVRGLWRRLTDSPKTKTARDQLAAAVSKLRKG